MRSEDFSAQGLCSKAKQRQFRAVSENLQGNCQDFTVFFLLFAEIERLNEVLAQKMREISDLQEKCAEMQKIAKGFPKENAFWRNKWGEENKLRVDFEHKAAFLAKENEIFKEKQRKLQETSRKSEEINEIRRNLTEIREQLQRTFEEKQAEFQRVFQEKQVELREFVLETQRVSFRNFEEMRAKVRESREKAEEMCRKHEALGLENRNLKEEIRVQRLLLGSLKEKTANFEEMSEKARVSEGNARSSRGKLEEMARNMGVLASFVEFMREEPRNLEEKREFEGENAEFLRIFQILNEIKANNTALKEKNQDFAGEIELLRKILLEKDKQIRLFKGEMPEERLANGFLSENRLFSKGNCEGHEDFVRNCTDFQREMPLKEENCVKNSNLGDFTRKLEGNMQEFRLISQNYETETLEKCKKMQENSEITQYYDKNPEKFPEQSSEVCKKLVFSERKAAGFAENTRNFKENEDFLSKTEEKAKKPLITANENRIPIGKHANRASLCEILNEINESTKVFRLFTYEKQSLMSATQKNRENFKGSVHEFLRKIKSIC